MIGPIYATATGAILLQMKLEAVTNDLANASTVGFKKSTVLFHDPIPKDPAGPAGQEAVVQTKGGIPVSGFSIHNLNDLSPGTFKETGNPLDFAIEGDGFFCVETPGGVRYTRDGSFMVNQNGELVTKQGYPVQGTAGKIAIQGSEIHVNPSGAFFVDGLEAGTLKVMRFPDPFSLTREGDNFFMIDEMEVAAVPAQDMIVHQGFLEYSNVNVIQTMTEMVEVLRGFESYQKILQSLNDVSIKTIQEVGKQG